MIKQDKTLVPEEENLLQNIVAKYLPYWPLFLAGVAVAVISGWIFLKVATPKYEATATLIIKDEKKGNEESKLMESLNQISAKKIVENEIEVLQSRQLMQNVAHTLHLYTPVTQKSFLRNKSAFSTSPVSVKAVNPANLKTKLNISLKYDSAKQQVTVDDRYNYPLNRSVQTPFGELEFVRNPNQTDVTESKNLFFSVYRPQELVPALIKSLKALPAAKLSSIINLSFRDEVPERAELILDELIHAYRDAEINEKNALAKNTLEFVNERLALIVKDLDTIQQKVQSYKAGRNAVDISTQGQLYLQNVSENDQKLSEVNTQLSVLNQVENFVKSSTGGAVVPSTLGVDDPLLSEMLTKLNTLELEYEKGKATIGENNPKLLEIKDQITKIKPNILRNINSQQRSLHAMRNNISSTNRSYNAILSQVPQKERQLIDITREEQNKRSIYEFLLQKKEESEIAYAASVANNKVVDFAEAGNRPVYPKRMVVYLAAISFMSLLFMGYVTVRESLTGKVLYRKEIESRTQIPIIGEIAFHKSKDPIVIAAGARSFIAEEFRKLRLSLSFLGINERHKNILVTSSISGEGKSFIAANLAISLTLTGKKVVLIDADLNNPSQEKIFKKEKTAGLSEYLQGEKDAVEIIRSVPEHENLHLISSGDLPHNPAELLSNGRVEELIDYLDQIFDIVIVDTSPMVLVTDGYMLTHLCDATLYVVRHQYTPKALIKRIDANNVINPIHNPAIIFNGVKQRGLLAANYGYGYGYDYVYGNHKIAKKIFEKS